MPTTRTTTRLVDAWRRHWLGPMPGHPIALFRILLGGYLLVYFLRFLPTVELLFSDQGVNAPLLLPELAPGPLGAWLMYLATLALILAFALGVRHRWVNPTLLLLFAHHYLLSLGAAGSIYDRLTLIFLAVTALADTSRVWSVERGWTSRGSAAAAVSAWPTRLLQLQIALFFFGSGAWKAASPFWQHAEMMRMTLASTWATSAAWLLMSLEPPRWFFQLLTTSIVAFELALGPALYFRRTRALAIAGGIGFNLSVWVFLGIPEFLNCIPGYLLFVEPATLERRCVAFVRWAGLRLNLVSTSCLARVDDETTPRK